MQPRHGLPPRPSLPPQQQQQFNQNPLSYSPIPSYTTFPPNPYQNVQLPATAGMASHYAQAYSNYYGYPGASTSSQPHANPQGYSYSSTYTHHPNFTFAPSPIPSRPSGQWYESGNIRCRKPGCSFTGSQKSVETHMMDRHLIFPPGWERRKRRDDWDADPSLKGKTLPIQGTSIKLDTPEAIEQWVAERKKRFPTANKVEEKQKVLGEAIARGELCVTDPSFSRKRRKLDRPDSQHSNSNRGGGRGRGRGRGGRGRHRGSLHNPSASRDGKEAASTTIACPVIPKSQPSLDTLDSYSSTDSDSDAAPEEISSKSTVPTTQDSPVLGEVEENPTQNLPTIRKPPPRRPKPPPRSLFGARAPLLRNLLIPEIRITVSNLSQAIRFLVQNDFLENVELKPGQANEKLIEVVGSSSSSEVQTGNTQSGLSSLEKVEGVDMQ